MLAEDCHTNMTPGVSGLPPQRSRASMRLSVIVESDVSPSNRASLLLDMAREQETELEELMHDSNVRPLLALVAHDNMKPLMATFAKSYQEQLADFRLTGTGTTCSMLRSIGLTPEDMSVPSGPLGGDQVLGGMIAEGGIKALFFFRDPLSAHAHTADIEALSRLSDVYQIYFSTNYRSAAAMLENLHKKLRDRLAQPSQTAHGLTPRQRASIVVPEQMADLGNVVQSAYKQTRQAAVKAAVENNA
jgi:methylglyoxal synthase